MRKERREGLQVLFEQQVLTPPPAPYQTTDTVPIELGTHDVTGLMSQTYQNPS